MQCPPSEPAAILTLGDGRTGHHGGDAHTASFEILTGNLGQVRDKRLELHLAQLHTGFLNLIRATVKGLEPISLKLTSMALIDYPVNSILMSCQPPEEFP